MDRIFIGDIIALILPVLWLIAFYKQKRLAELRHVLDRWFYIDFIYGKADIKSACSRKFFRLCSRLFEGFYVYIVPLILIQLIAGYNSLEIADFIFVFMTIVATPPICRIILVIQFKIHGIERKIKDSLL